MLSGIGDSSELTSLGITTRVNLPSVGKNMTDHTLLANAWQINDNQTINTYLTPDALPQLIKQWNQTHQGLLSWTTNTQMAWLRLPQDDPIIQTYGDPSPGPTSANFQFIWINGWAIAGVAEPEGSWMTITTNLISPTSRKCLISFTPLSNLSYLSDRWRGQTEELESIRSSHHQSQLPEHRLRHQNDSRCPQSHSAVRHR